LDYRQSGEIAIVFRDFATLWEYANLSEQILGVRASIVFRVVELQTRDIRKRFLRHSRSCEIFRAFPLIEKIRAFPLLVLVLFDVLVLFVRANTAEGDTAKSVFKTLRLECKTCETRLHSGFRNGNRVSSRVLWAANNSKFQRANHDGHTHSTPALGSG
jgi:hypothetical protein